MATLGGEGPEREGPRDAMSVFLEQIRLGDAPAAASSLDPVQAQLAKLKSDLERQHEVSRQIAKKVVGYRNDIATLERHAIQNRQIVEDRNIIIQNLQDELMTLQLEFTKKEEDHKKLRREKSKNDKQLMILVAKKDEIVLQQEEKIAILESSNRQLELDKQQLIDRWVALAEDKAAAHS